ncbi:MAG: hypothetical protein Q4G24_04215 [Paracoccus sp. (in: a-proteobacteria)]|uniref:hypothetical protein n=1 Tax=Paracoccus sp. TaxID=267 RepID=UPI0026E0B814|nr:hypothetical protein [Paracoccus sp. (in: a-proteobacteria)]MDO5620655.1 hypothetical protein [Paracoccus sp. (in: a-proteobacteria)]
MNKFMIAATTLTLAGATAVYAQDTTQAEVAAGEAAAAAEVAAGEAQAAAESAAATADAAASDAADAAAGAADAAAQAADSAGAAADAAAVEVVTGAAPVDPALAMDSPVLSAENPGMLASWITSQHVWTTNEPSTTLWGEEDPAERPAEWTDIAKISDVVIAPQGQVVGYVADIGGFLGIGAKQVLLGADQLNFMQFDEESLFATHMTKEELEALPEFNPEVVLK